MTENFYYVRWRGRRSGPYSANEIESLYDCKRITRLHHVSCDGVIWLPAEEIISQLRPIVNSDNSNSEQLSSNANNVKIPLVLKSDRVIKNTTPNIENEIPLANAASQNTYVEDLTQVTFFVRACAFFVDALCILGIISIISVVLIGLMLCARFDSSVITPIMRLYVPLLTCVVSWMYEVGFSVSHMIATPGKYWLGLWVSSEEGFAISLANANARFFAKLIGGALFGLGWLTVYGTRKCTLHDLICHTQVYGAQEGASY